MALCKVLVLVNVGILEFFHLARAVRGGAFTSRFKTDISCLIPSLSPDKKAQKLSQDEKVFFLKYSRWEAWKGISTEGRQSSSGRFNQGTRFSRKDWPRHPWPAGQAAFSLPGAILFGLERFSALKKPKHSKKESVRGFHFQCFNYIYINRKGSGLCVCLHMSICNLLGFIFVLAF